MRVGVVGVGAVGARAARQLVATPGVEAVVLRDLRPERLRAVVAALGDRAVADLGDTESPIAADVVILALPATAHRRPAEAFLQQGCHVVSVSDAIEDVRRLLSLDTEARERGLHVVVGAGFSPGLTCVLACQAAADFEQVEEVHVATSGTGGPSCARQHHRSLAGMAVDWRHGAWVERRAGSGRELCWFPDPVGAEDCYRAALPDALLLVPAFPGVERVTARRSANRRDRLTARLPMLRRPHPEGDVGAVRVEVRGRRGKAHDARVLGAMDRPAVGAGAVSAVAALWAGGGRMHRAGAAGLAELVEPLGFLSDLAERGVRGAVFDGTLHG